MSNLDKGAIEALDRIFENDKFIFEEGTSWDIFRLLDKVPKESQLELLERVAVHYSKIYSSGCLNNEGIWIGDKSVLDPKGMAEIMLRILRENPLQDGEDNQVILTCDRVIISCASSFLLEKKQLHGSTIQHSPSLKAV